LKILITGICGFVGSALARLWRESDPSISIMGVDNLIRNGSQTNREALKKLGVRVFHGDIRMASDFEALPAADVVIDAAANPSVLAGLDGRSSSRQVVEHNLLGTVNMLEFCKANKAGFVLLSTSRVYSIPPLAACPVESSHGAFVPAIGRNLPPGLSPRGVAEEFSTAAPVSLYGATKLASETLALEYGEAFGFPVWINRCGILAGAGQFGHAEQGIFSFWLHSWRAKRPLKYIGFGGQGHQVRDALHPRDLLDAVRKQLADSPPSPHRIFNLAGGLDNAISLANLSQWCEARWGRHAVAAQAEGRQYDIPWLVLDSARIRQAWNWRPTVSLERILEEIALFAEQKPDWLDLSSA
jgi:CDP-paratose 2-epimerase